MRIKNAAGALALLCLTPIAHARYGEGGWLFGGMGAGGIYVSTEEDSDINVGFKESKKMGYAIHLKGGLSWYMGSIFVTDFMAGFSISDVSGKAPEEGLESVAIKHRLGIFSISPRFRFGELGRWQVGPLYKLHFGTDSSFREREGQESGDKPLAHYFGVHVNYDIPSDTERTIYRVGLEAMTDISDKRSIYQGSVLFEVGFNLWEGSSAVDEPIESYPEQVEEEGPAIEEDLPVAEEAEVLPEPEQPQPEEILADPDAVTAQASGNAVMIRFPGDRFQFATGMSHIGSQKTREYIRELGEFMARNDDTWEKGSIVGHTDKRGPKGRERVVNLELSEARARTVYNAMVAAGVNPAKMRYEGRAFDEPVPGAPDNADGWKLNRRVEVNFEGVRAPEKILEQIEELNRRYGYGSSKVVKD